VQNDPDESETARSARLHRFLMDWSNHDLDALGPTRFRMQRFLILAGLVLLLTGLLWPWLSKLGLGRLPGDIVIERENTRIYFPIATSILISLVLSLIFWLFRK
jgi:hypothetical protein